MALPILVPIDMSLNEIRNMLAHIIAGNPGSPVEGQLWYNSTTKHLFFRTNTTNIDVTDALTLGGQNLAYILSRANHTGTQLAATIADFDTQVRTNRLDQMAIPTADLNLNTHKLINVVDPASPQDAATKAYVDSQAAGVRDNKDSVRLATTANLVLSGAQTIDGVAAIAGDRVLVKDQTLGQNNGIYVVAAGAWARSADADSSAEVNAGLYTWVEEGTTNQDTGWLLITNNPIVLGTTSLAFTQIAASSSVNGGAGLTKTGNTLDVGAGTGILVAADSVSIDPAVVSRRYATDVGDGAGLAFTVTHNLGTRDVIPMLRDNNSPYAYALPDFEAATINTVIVRFSVAPALNRYRVIVMG